jgi:hypothetical protein
MGGRKTKNKTKNKKQKTKTKTFFMAEKNYFFKIFFKLRKKKVNLTKNMKKTKCLQ